MGRSICELHLSVLTLPRRRNLRSPQGLALPSAVVPRSLWTGGHLLHGLGTSLYFLHSLLRTRRHGPVEAVCQGESCIQQQWEATRVQLAAFSPLIRNVKLQLSACSEVGCWRPEPRASRQVTCRSFTQVLSLLSLWIIASRTLLFDVMVFTFHYSKRRLFIGKLLGKRVVLPPVCRAVRTQV